VAMKDGRIAMGVVRAEGADAVKVSDIDAKQTIIPRADIEEIRPSSSSIMPVGLLGAIGEDSTRDLLAFLTAPVLKPAGQ
jgi:putative heme-binding domain-containing protein